jgi:hypothetical protein
LAAEAIEFQASEFRASQISGPGFSSWIPGDQAPQPPLAAERTLDGEAVLLTHE